MRRSPPGIAKPFLVRSLLAGEMRELVRHARQRRVTRNRLVVLWIRERLAALRGDAVPGSADPQDQGEAFPVLVQKHGYARAKAIEAARAERRRQERSMGEADEPREESGDG